ncbi:hypothetical protein [Cupriavidus sp. D39]|uniref:hypothetical protein n=1 Tax=Cupriavidus sp. D39 TaxID=2997877 RepID=UPI002271AF65|nr:hypothetical protein [Cupriavidus sp. D39]MCY0853236.1 hypothetical protein [Cupriavidus sp. D39]
MAVRELRHARRQSLARLSPGAVAKFQQDVVARNKQAVHQTSLDAQPSYDAKAAFKGIESFQARVQAIYIVVGYGLSIEVPFAAVTAIQWLASECASLNPLSPLSAQFPTMVAVQRRIVASLQAIAREVKQPEAWWADQDWARHTPVGAGNCIPLADEQQATRDRSVALVRARWADVLDGMQQLTTFKLTL